MSEGPSHSEVGRILSQVLMYPSDEQHEAIRELCGDDLRLRTEIESLVHNRPAAELLQNSIMQLHSLSTAVRTARPRYPSLPGFEIIDVLGHGSSGIVYLAEQACPRRKVAIKVLKSSLFTSEQNERMLAEMHILARLEHPSIARLYEVGVLESGPFEHPFFVMEYCQGTPLTRAVEIQEFKWHSVQVIRGIAEAIQYAHDKGVVHRDIKPSNILVRACGVASGVQIQLIDFGIARLYRGQPLPVDIQTATEALIGTRKYMSPERIARATNGADPSSDIYSLGVIICELIESACWPPDSAKRFREICEWMTMEDPQMRPQCMAEVIQAIDMAGEDKTTSGYHSPLTRVREIVRSCFPVGAIVAAVCFWSTVSQSDQERHVSLVMLEQEENHAPQRVVRNKAHTIHQLLTSSESRHNWWATHQLAHSLSQSGRSKEALAMLEDFESRMQEFLQSDPVSHRSHLTLKGLCFLRIGDQSAAISQYTQALSLIQERISFTEREFYDLTSVAYGFQSCGRLDAAEEIYLELLHDPMYASVSPKHRIRAQQCYAGMMWLTQRYDQAEVYFRSAVNSFPETFELSPEEAVHKAVVISSHGVSLMALSKFTEAEERLICAVNTINGVLDPTDIRSARLLRNLCTCYVLSGQYDLAKERLSILMALWSENPSELKAETANAYFLLGSVELAAGDLNVAFGHLSKSVELLVDQNDTESRRIRALAENSLGAALMLSGDQEEGLVLLRKSSRVIEDEYSATHPWRLLAQQRAVDFMR